MKIHAGEYHNDDCKFPTNDQAVCNCPKNLFKKRTKNEEQIEKEIWRGMPDKIVGIGSGTNDPN